MGLRGLREWNTERGYAMAALLIALAIMAVLLTMAMPVWRHEARREKEAELVFRGEQYARAVALFRTKNQSAPNLLPPSIDFLVQNRFLRKKYKDPMTKDGEFLPLQFGSTQPGINPAAGAIQPGATQPGGRSNTPLQPPGQVAGGISGVRSKSEETSIRSYRGATRYDQWQFTFNIAPRPGGAMPLANSPDGRGNPLNPTRGNPGSRGGTDFGRGRMQSPTQPPGTGTRGAAPAGRGRGF